MGNRTMRIAALGASVAAVGVGAAGASAATSTQLSAAMTSSECASVATAQVFRKFKDLAQYAAVLGGNMEPAGQASWLLLFGSGFVAGNETAYLGGRDESYSLRLPAGSLANAPWVCVGSAFPTARFMVRNTGASTGRLRVDVQYASADFTRVGNVTLASVAAGSKWAPSPLVPLSLPADAAYYRINFSSVGPGALFQMDSLYIDPMRRSV